MSSRCPDGSLRVPMRVAGARLVARAIAGLGAAACFTAIAAETIGPDASPIGGRAEVTGAPSTGADPGVLRVCADPDNLPYSSADESGFEYRIARLLADDLHRRLEYEWQPQRRGFVRKTVGAGLCEVFIGVPAGFERVSTTRPYYRSGYVFVNRADAPRGGLQSFDAPRLPTLAIGVQLIGEDLAATPAGHALARHGAVDRVVGYT